MKAILALCILFSTLAACEAAGAGRYGPALDIYFVRHAETVYNRTHIKSRANKRTLSSEGKRQVRALTKKLAGRRFDHILVSPKIRAMKTILPYLRKYHRMAEIWPELEECCWQKRKSGSPSGRLAQGDKIVIPPAMRAYFRFRNSASQRRYAPANYADGLVQVRKCMRLINKRFSRSGKSILIVGHYHAGARLIDILQGRRPRGSIHLSNAKISHLRESGAGIYRIISLNQ